MSRASCVDIDAADDAPSKQMLNALGYDRVLHVCVCAQTESLTMSEWKAYAATTTTTTAFSNFHLYSKSQLSPQRLSVSSRST